MQYIVSSVRSILSATKKEECGYVCLARCLHCYGLLKTEIDLAVITAISNHGDLHRFSITREKQDIRVLEPVTLLPLTAED